MISFEENNRYYRKMLLFKCSQTLCYLMSILAGRSFNDLMQYPVFPWVISDYSSKSLDLTNPKSFRDLRKPMAIQKRDREQSVLTNYKNLEKEEFQESQHHGGVVGPYHYGSHYSNSGIVLQFLIRMPPFTSMFLKYQDGHFDMVSACLQLLLVTFL